LFIYLTGYRGQPEGATVDDTGICVVVSVVVLSLAFVVVTSLICVVVLTEVVEDGGFVEAAIMHCIPLI